VNPGVMWLTFFGVSCLAVGEMIGAKQMHGWSFWCGGVEIVFFFAAVCMCLAKGSLPRQTK
jgi:hypothetical protein